ncbi:hypothetical protein PR003_g3485 [Phytophthora rubi]|uniref:Uncharacterized protein n=1 Tax=Phytophthora rubi TaxID=129364 RepID=A0A6A3NJY5_9STRA|nr:hypothetical protein PR002_g3258 [Phytophthora rubi]KAE9354203.1 hypothetical protein PR003_g3485 [Phytophthora rubi]
MSKRSFSIAVPQVEPPKKQRLVDHDSESPQVIAVESTVNETPKARVLIPTEAERAKIRQFPLLAFAAPYRGGKFYYERECYDEYYQIVTKELVSSAVEGSDGVGEDCVTVSGTPGIGKSVFYAYFFERYRKEHPNTWIIAMAFEEKQVKKLTVAAVGKEPVYYRSNVGHHLDQATLEAEKWENATEDGVTDKRVLFLCDGPPDISRRQSVVFTNPSKRWHKVSRKFYCDYYMPLWTLDELQEAATLLNYPISDDLIKERFEKFGGIARECLCLDPVISKKAELDLTKQMNAIFDPNELRKLLLEYETSHYLVHYAPKANRAFTGRQLASDFVEQKLQERMLTKSYEQREDLRNLISSWEGAYSLRGWIFEVDAHEKLRQGNTLHGLTLPVVEHEEAYDKVWVQFHIEKREQIDVFDAENLSPSLAKCGPYHKPNAKNWASIDYFYLPKMEMSRKVTKADIAQWCNSTDKRLLLFQMTVAETHPVKASGVLNVLEKLGLLSHLELVALVFVVPKKLLQTFRRQEIVGIPTTGTASVHSIAGIGKRIAELLE